MQAKLSCLVFLSFVISGCTVTSGLLPAHSNSFFKEKERVEVEFLTKDDIKQGKLEYYRMKDGGCQRDSILYSARFKNAFGVDVDEAETQRAGAAAWAASYLAGLAIDAVASQLQQEATLYEAQFGKTQAYDDFWIWDAEDYETSLTLEETIEKQFKLDGKKYNEKGQEDEKNGKENLEGKFSQGIRTETRREVKSPKLKQKYWGVRIRRTVRGPDLVNAKDCTPSNSDNATAFELVLGIAPSRDQQMFRIAPLLFWTPLAKAKVLSNEYWSWLPPMILGKLYGSPGSEIDSNVTVQIQAYWRGSDQQLHTSTVGTIPLNFTSYDIEKREVLAAGKPSEWLLAVPVSYKANGVPAPSGGSSSGTSLGTFSIKVSVVEKT